MDSYQAIYDAVRSRISGGNISDAVERAFRDNFTMGMTREIIQQEWVAAAFEVQRPCVLFRPSIYIDGGKWCALYGDDLQSGVAGFGDSPALAMEDFDRNWRAKLPDRALPSEGTQEGGR